MVLRSVMCSEAVPNRLTVNGGYVKGKAYGQGGIGAG